MLFSLVNDYVGDLCIDKEILVRLGVEKLRTSQEKIVDFLINHDKDLLAVLPTGGGKTLCFQYSALVLDCITIIIYPLLSLMKDQENRFKKSKIPIAVLKGGQTKKQRDKIFNDIENGKVKAIITNPETLIQEKILRNFYNKKLHLVIDECHTIVEWGEEFRPAMLLIGEAVAKLKPIKVSCFTATLSAHAEEGLRRYIFSKREYEKIYFSANRENIEYSYIVTNSKSYALYNALLHLPRPCIVFANNRKLCEDICSFIGDFYIGYDVKYYHAGLSKIRRKSIEDWFYRAEEGILVATCAFGMGVDKSNIRSVVHYMLPKNVSAFLQESGRAGRDGKGAHSYSIIGEHEIEKLKSLDTKILFNCFLDGGCIRKNLLLALGEKPGADIHCNNCQNCLHKNSKDKYTLLAKAVFSDWQRVFDENTIALLLKGIELKSIPFSSHLPFFGLMKDVDIVFITQFLRESHIRPQTKAAKNKNSKY